MYGRPIRNLFRLFIYYFELNWILFERQFLDAYLYTIVGLYNRKINRTAKISAELSLLFSKLIIIKMYLGYGILR